MTMVSVCIAGFEFGAFHFYANNTLDNGSKGLPILTALFCIISMYLKFKS